MNEVLEVDVPPSTGRYVLGFVYEVLLLIAIVFLAAILCSLILPLLLGLPVSALSTMWWSRALTFLFVIGCIFAYFGYCWRRGRTLAMSAWRLRIEDAHGGLPQWRSVVARFIAAGLFYGPFAPFWTMAAHRSDWSSLAWLATAWVAAPFIWSRFDRDGQLLHDRLAGTRLIFTAFKIAQPNQQGDE